MNAFWSRCSVALNVVLAAALAWEWQMHHSARSANAVPAHPAPAGTEAGKSVVSRAGAPTKPMSWTDSMAELRRVGVPAAVIAKLVIEKVAQKWTPLEQKAEEDYLNDRIKPKDLAEMRDRRAREQEEELRAALGDGYRAWDKENTVSNMFLGGLDPTEAQKEPLYVLQQDHLKRLHDLEVRQRDGSMDERAYLQAHDQEEQQYKNALADIVGRERVFGRPPAEAHFDEVRRQFASLQLSEAQVKQLAQIQQTWSDARGALARSLDATQTLDAAYEGDLNALDRARDDEFRRALGDAFDAWQKTRDSRYDVVARNIQRWNLPLERADAIYRAIRNYELVTANYEHQAQIQQQQGQPVDSVAVETTLANYTRQTEAALRRYLGDDKF